MNGFRSWFDASTALSITTYEINNLPFVLSKDLFSVSIIIPPPH